MSLQNQVDPNQTQPQRKTFDPSAISRSYNSSQWQMKEDWYTKQVNAIVIPPDPNPAIIQNIASQIDRMLTIARLDSAYIQQNADRYKMHLKYEEQRLFVELKMNTPQQYSSLKLTVDEMKGIVASTLKNNNWQNMQYSLLDLVSESNSRSVFMDAVLKSLNDKKDLLITHSGMLKIENSISAMSSSVPKGSVPNG